MRHLRSIRSTYFLIVAALAACGGDGGITEVEPDEAIEPFVGTWEADSLTLTSVADMSIVANLLEVGGSFTINVQPSGAYTATLVFTDGDTTVPSVEIGQMTVSDDFITLDATQPDRDPVTSSYTFLSSDRLRLEGPTEFDFNFDGDADPALAYFELVRQ